MVIPIWMDCDPGHDDAIALLLASSLPDFDLVGVSTTHGNASLEHTTNNAVSILTAYNVNGVGVFPGAEKPLEAPLSIASDIHGESGLDGTALLPNPGFEPDADHSALEEMHRQIGIFDGKICICATGPLTNIATLIQRYPEVVDKIQYLSIMGGAIGFGNRTEYAEFNIYADPEAAAIVFGNDTLASKILLCPLNVTHKAIATKEVLNQIRTAGAHTDGVVTPVRQMLFELITYFADTYRKVQNFTEGPPVHDPVAVACLLPFFGISQDLSVRYDEMKITIALTGERRGETAGVPVRSDQKTQVKGVSKVIKDMDFKVFWNLVYTALENVDRRTESL